MDSSVPEHYQLLLLDSDRSSELHIRHLIRQFDVCEAQLTQVLSVEQGTNLLSEQRFDLILMHYQFVTGTPEPVLEQLRGLQNIPVILFSENEDRAADQSAITLGAADYLVKASLSAAHLQRALRYAIERHRILRRKMLYKQALDATHNGVVISDATAPDLPVVYVNKAFERITGFSAAETLGQNCRFLQGDFRDEGSLKRIRSAIDAKRDCHITLQNTRKDGSAFWNKLYLSPVYDESAVLTHYIGVQHDITEQRQFEIAQAHNASHDLLTGLPNRSLLQDRLAQWCQFSRRNQRNLAVLLIDLDGFQLVNDSLGHQFGDRLLIDVAQRLDRQIRPGDTLARIGSDEFVVLLTDIQHKDDVVIIASRLLECINQTYLIDGQEIHLTASIGLTESDGYLSEPMELIQQADLAMHQAKQYGNNNFQWFDSDLNQAVNKTLVLRSQLQKALLANEFELHYQPQIDAFSGKVIGLEALIRWPQPQDGRVLSPAEFIPVAEESGQIIPLSEWVFEQAATQLKQLHQQGFSWLKVAVNVSATHFKRLNFVDSIQKILEKTALEPQFLELELTEGILFENSELAIQKLLALKTLGVKIAIDDFGTGFSSLNYLKRLPIDKIKIDRSFIKDIVSDQHDAAISQAIISIARLLDLKVIAEGVETAAQIAFLGKNLCDEYQGYYYAPALNLDALNVFLKQHQQSQALPADACKQHTILLLDDEENTLNALIRLLRRENYHILTASSAEQAFELLALHQVQVIMSDQRMMQMSGTEFLKRVKDMYPDTVRIVLSGYTDLRSLTEAINNGAIYKFLTKPWDDQQLKLEIRQAFLQAEQQHKGYRA